MSCLAVVMCSFAHVRHRCCVVVCFRRLCSCVRRDIEREFDIARKAKTAAGRAAKVVQKVKVRWADSPFDRARPCLRCRSDANLVLLLLLLLLAITRGHSK